MCWYASATPRRVLQSLLEQRRNSLPIPFSLMSLTFLSKSLNRTISFADLDALSTAEARTFLGELHIAAASMEDSLASAKASGTPNPDWVHSITKKARICSAFQAQVSGLVEQVGLPSGSSPALNGPATYQQLLHTLAHAEFKRELGTVYDQIMQDAHEAAVSTLQQSAAGLSGLAPVPAGTPGA